MHARVHHALPTIAAELQDRPAVHVLEGHAPAAGRCVPPVGARHCVPPPLSVGPKNFGASRTASGQSQSTSTAPREGAPQSMPTFLPLLKRRGTSSTAQ